MVVSTFPKWVFHGAFHQNNVAQVCSCSSTRAMRSVMTSRVRRADITQRIHKRTTANNNMAQRRLDAHNAALYGHYTSREICHSESSAGSYHWMNLIVMRQNTVDQLSCSKLSQTREDKRVATIKDSVGVTNSLWRMLRLCSTLIYSGLVSFLLLVFSQRFWIWLEEGRINPRFLFSSSSLWGRVMMKMQPNLPEGHPHWTGKLDW